MRGFELGQLPRMFSNLMLLYCYRRLIYLRPQFASSTHKRRQVSILRS
jgi:hypothetical protein